MPNVPYSPINIEEVYSYIQSIYDCCEQYSQMYDSVRKMKQAWAQQKYRLNLNGRKQSTFVLRAEAKEQLQELARARNINLNQMLETIIEKEYKIRKAEKLSREASRAKR
jgi:post-segregation antitoxin (ccd killing protein)